MALVRLKNVGQAILFVDSLNLVLRPNEIRLFDEEKAKNDSQLMQCILLGKVLVARMEGDFVSYAEVKEVPPAPPAPRIEAPRIEAPFNPQPAVQPMDKNAASVDAVLEARKAYKQGGRNLDDEPKNSTPVVMFGDVPQRKATSINSEIAMPNYINPDDLIGSKSDGDLIDKDISDGDIIYADAADQIALGSEGIIDAREK